MSLQLQLWLLMVFPHIFMLGFSYIIYNKLIKNLPLWINSEQDKISRELKRSFAVTAKTNGTVDFFFHQKQILE